MRTEHPGVAQARSIKTHISGLVARLPDALGLSSGVVDFRPPGRTPPGTDDPACEPETQTNFADLYLQGVTTVDVPPVSPAADDDDGSSQ